MKTLCIQYTPDKINISLAIDAVITKTESFSSKETKMLIPYLQRLLASTGLKMEDIHNICVNIGPAPAFTQRSLFAAWNGIAMALRLQNKDIHLFAVDDFKLLYVLQQQKNPDFHIVVLANAYANDLFFLHSKNDILEFDLVTLEECYNRIEILQQKIRVKIVGTLTENQETFFTSRGIEIANNTIVSHDDYCHAAFLATLTDKPVDFLFPHYTKLHAAEVKIQKNK